MDQTTLIRHQTLSMEKTSTKWKPSWLTEREEDKCSILSNGKDMTQVITHGNQKQISQTQMKLSLNTKDRETLTETVEITLHTLYNHYKNRYSKVFTHSPL